MTKYKFIVIDDSELDCYIAEKMIRHDGRCDDVKCFTGATEALNYLSELAKEEDTKIVIILDVLMPLMSGFEFVEEFEKIPNSLRSNVQIIALTSSMNKNDIDKISSYSTVTNVLDKPINAASISAIFE